MTVKAERDSKKFKVDSAKSRNGFAVKVVMLEKGAVLSFVLGPQGYFLRQTYIGLPN